RDESPVAGRRIVEIDAAARRLDLFGELENAVPGLRQIVRIAAGRLHQIAVEIDGRDRDRKGNAIGLGVNLADLGDRLGITETLPVRLRLDELVKRDGEVTVGKELQEARTLEGDIRNSAGDRRTQHELRHLRISLDVRKVDLGARMTRLETLGDGI